MLKSEFRDQFHLLTFSSYSSVTAGGFTGGGRSHEPIGEPRAEASSLWIISQPSAGLQVIQVDCTATHSTFHYVNKTVWRPWGGGHTGDVFSKLLSLTILQHHSHNT